MLGTSQRWHPADIAYALKGAQVLPMRFCSRDMAMQHRGIFSDHWSIESERCRAVHRG